MEDDTEEEVVAEAHRVEAIASDVANLATGQGNVPMGDVTKLLQLYFNLIEAPNTNECLCIC